jgi:hypothetical protein
MFAHADRVDRFLDHRLAQHPLLCHRPGNLIAIFWICFAEMPDQTFDDIFASDFRKSGRDVRDQSLLLLIARQTVEMPSLNEIVVAVAARSCRPSQLEGLRTVVVKVLMSHGLPPSLRARQPTRNIYRFRNCLVGGAGFEPATPGL